MSCYQISSAEGDFGEHIFIEDFVVETVLRRHG